MESKKYINGNLDALTGQNGLNTNLPLFYLIIFLIPIFYITGKLAEEKESKAREGMKMMGLKDATYYFSWIVLYTLIIFVTSIIITSFESKIF